MNEIVVCCKDILMRLFGIWWYIVGREISWVIMSYNCSLKLFSVICCKCESFAFINCFACKVDANWSSPSFVVLPNLYVHRSVGLGLFNILMISDADCHKKESIVTVGVGMVCGIKWSVSLIISLFVDGT